MAGLLSESLKRRTSENEFEDHETTICSLNDSGDESPEGELTDGILDQLAKFERAKTVMRTAQAI